MIISLIAALTPEHVIGNNQSLPWHLPADLKHFKSVTLGKSIIMGRKTFESIKKPLPGRHNIIISHQKQFAAPGAHVVHNLNEALNLAKNETEVFIIGGATLYEQTLPLAHFLYLTLIHATIAGDVYFPFFNRNEWEEIDCQHFSADEQNAYSMSFITLKNKIKNK